ncbi:hypothetical protein NMY22_g9864 [Coprinellus aureogranulatus]|nr:hypothetical protein NMY22_g9864 [Coprinellus aureogranulatus]
MQYHRPLWTFAIHKILCAAPLHIPRRPCTTARFNLPCPRLFHRSPREEKLYEPPYRDTRRQTYSYRLRPEDFLWASPNLVPGDAEHPENENGADQSVPNIHKSRLRAAPQCSTARQRRYLPTDQIDTPAFLLHWLHHRNNPCHPADHQIPGSSVEVKHEGSPHRLKISSHSPRLGSSSHSLRCYPQALQPRYRLDPCPKPKHSSDATGSSYYHRSRPQAAPWGWVADHSKELAETIPAPSTLTRPQIVVWLRRIPTQYNIIDRPSTFALHKIILEASTPLLHLFHHPLTTARSWLAVSAMGNSGVFSQGEGQLFEFPRSWRHLSCDLSGSDEKGLWSSHYDPPFPIRDAKPTPTTGLDQKIFAMLRRKYPPRYGRNQSLQSVHRSRLRAAAQLANAVTIVDPLASLLRWLRRRNNTCHDHWHQLPVLKPITRPPPSPQDLQSFASVRLFLTPQECYLQALQSRYRLNPYPKTEQFSDEPGRSFHGLTPQACRGCSTVSSCSHPRFSGKTLDYNYTLSLTLNVHDRRQLLTHTLRVSSTPRTPSVELNTSPMSYSEIPCQIPHRSPSLPRISRAENHPLSPKDFVGRAFVVYAAAVEEIWAHETKGDEGITGPTSGRSRTDCIAQGYLELRPGDILFMRTTNTSQDPRHDVLMLTVGISAGTQRVNRLAFGIRAVTGWEARPDAHSQILARLADDRAYPPSFASDVVQQEGLQSSTLEATAITVKALLRIVAGADPWHGKRSIVAPKHTAFASKVSLATSSTTRIFGRMRTAGTPANCPRSGKASDHLFRRFEIANGSDSHHALEVDNSGSALHCQLRLEELSSYVLVKMKETAEQFLNKKVYQKRVPAYFNLNEAQRQATKDAGQIAGLDMLLVMSQPLLLSPMALTEAQKGVFEVKSTNGDTHLGGEDFDIALVNHILSELKENSIDLTSDRIPDRDQPKLPLTTANASGPKHINLKLNNSQFEALVQPLVQRTIEPCKKALADAGVKAGEVNDVVLVGGMSRMPVVVDTVKIIFGRDPSKGVNLDDAVAIGASIQGGLINHNTTSIPTKKSQFFFTATDGQTAIEVKVYQGERELGVPQIEITFDIDDDGIFNVSAKDKATGNDQSMAIASSSGLSDKDIERTVADAEQFAEADKQRCALIEEGYKADSAVNDTKKAMNKFKEQLDAEENGKVEKSAVAELRELASKGQAGDSSITADAIREKIHETQRISLGLFKKVYEKRAAENSSSEQPSENKEEKKDFVVCPLI